MTASRKIPRGRTLNKLPDQSTATKRKRTPLRRFVNWSLAPVVILSLKLWYALGKTVVMQEDGTAPNLALDKGYVFAGWHEQLLNGCDFMAGEVRKGRQAITLTSPSVDGDFISNIAMSLGGDVVRGSATRSGFRALRALLSAMRKTGSSSYFPTDGPRGPARESKSGVIMLARIARVPLVPLVCVASPEKRFGTWDRLRLPYPFAKKIVLVGKPQEIPRDLDDTGIEMAARDLDIELARLTTLAEALARA